jgi:hypothetical protein
VKNKRQRDEDTADRADPLFAFLGGDDTALRIFRALERDGILTVDELRRQYRLNWVRDARGIGPAAMNRIREKLGEPG